MSPKCQKPTSAELEYVRVIPMQCLRESLGSGEISLALLVQQRSIDRYTRFSALSDSNGHE